MEVVPLNTQMFFGCQFLNCVHLFPHLFILELLLFLEVGLGKLDDYDPMSHVDRNLGCVHCVSRFRYFQNRLRVCYSLFDDRT